MSLIPSLHIIAAHNAKSPPHLQMDHNGRLLIIEAPLERTATASPREAGGGSSSLLISSTDGKAAADLGRSLEELIHTASLKIPGLTHSLRELEIRSHFSDASLNGVDHWIQVGKLHILIQDKWKESTSQPEVAQFLTCADRIRTRIPADEPIYLIWASKREPTSNAGKILDEHSTTKVCCSINIESLARCVILQVCECLGVDCIDPLRAILNATNAIPMAASKRDAPAAAPIILSYDDTEEGKIEIADIKRTIEILHTMMRRVYTAISYEGSSDVHALWNATTPKTVEDWINGKYSKIDYTAFLKAMKSICCPSAKKPLQSRSLFLYVKLRKLSVDLSTNAITYESKRKSLITKKSIWVKSLSTFKSVAEPITEAEFKSCASHCEDYWENRMNPITRKIEKVPAVHIDTAFWTHQCMI